MPQETSNNFLGAPKFALVGSSLAAATTTTTTTTRRNLQDIHSGFHPFTLQIWGFLISIRMKINETTTITTVTTLLLLQPLSAPPKHLSDPNPATWAELTVN